MLHPAEVDERVQRARSGLLRWSTAPTPSDDRGRGLARRFVGQSARRVLDDGVGAVYLHDPANVASARTADASGSPDVGWRISGRFGGGAGTP